MILAIFKTRLRYGMIAVVVLSAAAQSRAALVINPTYSRSVTRLPYAAQVESAVNYVIQEYESLFSNSITINITIAATSNSSVLGESNTNLLTGYSYAQVRNALSTHATTANDALAVASLGATDPTGGANFLIPVGEAQALGLDSPTDPQSAGTFTFGTSLSYSFDPNNRAVSTTSSALPSMKSPRSWVATIIWASAAQGATCLTICSAILRPESAA
jgi:hypothetical protein